MDFRYPQSHERSAEILRAVLHAMGQHAACWNPTTYAVWYEHCAGMNARLSHALDALLLEQPRLGDADMLRLYEQYVAPADQHAVQHISRELQRVMSDVAHNASHTGDSAGRVGARFDALASEMQTADAKTLPALLDSAAANASSLKQATGALVQQIRDGQSEIERLRADLVRARDEALLDPMTRVLNRKGFDQEVRALLQESPASGTTHSLIMFDIDHFKLVNDTHGHVLGDRVIQGLAELLRVAVPGGTARVARYGGEEFAMLLPATSPERGLQVAEAVRQRAGAMKIRDLRSQRVVMSVTVSAGVASVRPDDDAPSWVARADAALYLSKQAGRNRVTSA